jgi:hypothetical protein
MSRLLRHITLCTPGMGLKWFCRKVEVAMVFSLSSQPLTDNVEQIMISFKGRHFPKDILLTCVRWYLAYKLSYRDI